LVDGIGIAYAGEVLSNSTVNNTATNWAPDSSFVGGSSTTSPSSVGDIITIAGLFTGTNTVSFSSPVVDPLLAIWSLGAPGLPASFSFAETPTFEAGGPNAQFGGSAIGAIAEFW
jgi:hypothetical protein